MNIPFSPPYIDDCIIDEVVDTLRSGWITTGPKVKALEEETKSLTGAKEVLCVNSWTSGAIMILRWFGVEKEDEVIIPAYSYCATALAVLHAGAKVIMVDCGKDFNISLEAIRKAITPKTKVIIPVDIAGFPCDYEKILSLIQEPKIQSIFQPTTSIQKKINRILIINDAAHSLGAFFKKGQQTGSGTDITIFSFHAVKNITTAEGGAICLNMPAPFNNNELYKELRRMTLNCQTKDALTKSKACEWKYDIAGMGMKINMADINAAIGLAQIRSYSKLLKKRKYIFEYYNNFFRKKEWAIIPPSIEDDRETSYHIYALRIKGFSESQRDQMIENISKKGVAVNVHFIPIPMLSFFRDLHYNITNYPESYNNYKCEISLPIYPQLNNKELDYIIYTVKLAYETTVNNNTYF